MLASVISDDVLLYKITESANDPESLQRDLNSLTDWANTWQTEFNHDNSEHLQLSLKRPCFSMQYCIQGELIKKAVHTK